MDDAALAYQAKNREVFARVSPAVTYLLRVQAVKPWFYRQQAWRPAGEVSP